MLNWVLENMLYIMLILFVVSFVLRFIKNRKISKLPIKIVNATVVDLDYLRKERNDNHYSVYEVTLLDENGKVHTWHTKRKIYNELEIGQRGQLKMQDDYFHSFDGFGTKLKGDETYV